MDVTIERVAPQDKAAAPSTWVSRTPKGTYSPGELWVITSTRPIFWKILSELANTTTGLDKEIKERVDTAYQNEEHDAQ